MGNQPLLQALAFLIENFGYRIDKGKELYFSDEKLATIGIEGQLQVNRHPEKPGICVRYFPCRTIEAEVNKGGDEPNGSGPPQLAQADEPPTA
jgi:hypothetical protein